MFVNQINSKDLFTTNPMKVYGGKDYVESQQGGSQMCSQFEFSQGSSQEFFSQQQNTTISQHSQSPQKKGYFQKYVSRGPAFTSCPKQTQPSVRPSYRQEFEANKGRAKEKDERDLLYTIANTVNQSAAEVKSAVEFFKQNGQNESSTTEKLVTEFLHELKSDLDKRYEEVVDSIRRANESKEEVHSLKEEIAAKNATVTDLQAKIDELQRKQDEKIVEELKEVYKEQQELNRQQIHQYHQQQLKELSKQANLHKEYQATLDSHSAQLQKTTEKNQKQFSKLEAQLAKELDSYQRDQQTRYDQLTNECQQQLRNLHHDQRNELVDYFSDQLAKNHNLTSERQKELEQSFREDIDRLAQEQREELETMIQQQLQEELKNQEEKQRKLQLENQRINEQKLDKSSNEPRPFSRNRTDSFNQDLMQQRQKEELQLKELENLKNKHKLEYETLKEKHYTSNRPSQNPRCPDVGTTASSTRRDQRTSKIDLPVRASSSCPRYFEDQYMSSAKGANLAPFISPTFRKPGWSSRTLFGKGSPSPIATVYPQVKEPRVGADKNFAYGEDEEGISLAVNQVPGQARRGRRGRGRGRGPRKRAVPTRVQPQRRASLGEDSRKSLNPDYRTPALNVQQPMPGRPWQSCEATQLTQPTISPYSLRSYNNTPDVDIKPTQPTSGQIECSEMGLKERFNSSGKKPILQDVRMDVFDFSEDDTPVCAPASLRNLDYNKKSQVQPVPFGSGFTNRDGYSIITNHNNSSDSSACSSPSLSVTELVIQRKVKKDRESPACERQEVTFEGKNSLISPSGSDVFGSPDLFRPQMELLGLQEMRPKRQRVQCDGMVDTEILQITQCIKRQQRVKQK